MYWPTLAIGVAVPNLPLCDGKPVFTPGCSNVSTAVGSADGSVVGAVLGATVGTGDGTSVVEVPAVGGGSIDGAEPVIADGDARSTGSRSCEPVIGAPDRAETMTVTRTPDKEPMSSEIPN